MPSKKTFAKIALVFLVTFNIAMPVFAFAQTSNAASKLWQGGFWGPLVSCTGSAYGGGAKLISNGTYSTPTNPCQNLCDLIQTAINILYFIMSIALYIATPIMFAWGAIMIMVAGANPEMLGTGKKMLTGAVVGLAIILCSYLLISTVLGVLGVTSVGGFGGQICQE